MKISSAALLLSPFLLASVTLALAALLAGCQSHGARSPQLPDQAAAPPAHQTLAGAVFASTVQHPPAASESQSLAGAVLASSPALRPRRHILARLLFPEN